MDGLPDGILLLDESWRITYANKVGREISRIQPGYINGKTHWELYPETLGTPVEITYREAMETGSERTLGPFFYEPFKIWLHVRAIRVEGGLLLHYRDLTAEHEAQTARKSTAEQLEQVLAATTDGVVQIDRDYRITYMNQRAAEILAPSGDILNTNLWESFPDAVYPGSPYVKHYDRALYEGIPGSFEAFYPAPLNTWLQLIVRPSPSGFIAFFRDITEQKQREEALRSSEARYRALTELSPQSQWTANPEGLVLYANQRFLEYIGMEMVPRTGMEYIECFNEADRERVVQVWSHCVATGEHYDIEARLLRGSDGASRWWHLRALPVRNESGAIEQWLGTADDVHEARMAADQLHEQYEEIDRRRREMETVYHSSPIGMALYEPKELRLLRINERLASTFGVTPEEAVGKTFDELTAGVSEGRPLIRRAALGETVLNQDIDGVLDSHPGEHRFWNVNYSPIFAEDGTVQAIAGASIEITLQKRAEAALIQSEKLAAVGRMASSIAHEINNPLESVMNLIYIARQHAILPEVQQFLDLADQELRRVSIIANQTLRFHKQASNPREIACTELYTTVLSLYEGRLKNSAIKVEKRKRATRPIECFEGDIRQVLNNLVGNAIDAMPQGGRLLLRSRDAFDWKTGRRGLALTVADTGPGMDAATQKRIFEAFFTTKGISGTGLGLWISTGIMDRHQGRIRVRSSQHEGHRGTVFQLFLPFEAVATTAAAGVTSSAA